MRTSITAIIAAIVAVTAFPGIASAEKGRFSGHCVLVSTKFNEVKAMDGHPMKSAMSGELDGLVFGNGGGGRLDRLLDKAHYHVAWVGDGGGGGYCLKTFTNKDGHKLFARCDSQGTPTGSAGVITLLGGTGPFTGIKGKGKFNFVSVTPAVAWDDIEWEWETP
ncbi:MAG: hypothetical protein IPK20_08290 [Betaproteobacteria bacterium]|nr:hypothetical protein [Betaproteobacteria bacterium]